jgi:retron-type reverse transcriptase
MVDSDPDHFLWDLHNSLKNKTFRTSPYVTKQIYEPKPRIIYKLPYYPDRIVHHAIMNVLQPIWDKTFIYDLYSAIPGKGLHAGSYRLRQFMRDIENTRYCLKFDISKFYPSINHDILVDKIRKKIKCKDTLWLLEEIVRSPGGNTNTPIGNYLSQYFSNIYLSDFDHWIKEEKRMRYYIRYCDDGVILHGNKNTLLKLYADIDNYLSDNLKLTLNPKTKIIDVGKQGIDFLGYRCFRGYT